MTHTVTEIATSFPTFLTFVLLDSLKDNRLGARRASESAPAQKGEINLRDYFTSLFGESLTSFPKYRWTTRSEELQKEISSLQDKLKQENLSCAAVNEIANIIETKKSELKNIRNNRHMDLRYITTDDE
jgi:hypothetical protein